MPLKKSELGNTNKNGSDFCLDLTISLVLTRSLD